MVYNHYWSNNVSELSANWSDFEDDGEVTYEYAIGSLSNSTEVTGDNYSLSFDGNDDFVELMNIPSGLSSFSYGAGIKKLGANGSGQPHTQWHSCFLQEAVNQNRDCLSKWNGSSPTYEMEQLIDFGLSKIGISLFIQ